MNKNSVKWFWIILVLMTFIIDHNFVKLISNIIVGDLNVAEGFKNTYKHFSFGSYISLTFFRLIPCALLGIIVSQSIYKERRATAGIAWGGLIGISYTLIIVEGSWIFFLWPFAIATGFIGGLIGWGIHKILLKRKENLKKRF